jgi:hypothetical protein
MKRFAMVLWASAALCAAAQAQDTNVKIVTDASPDYSDIDSMVRSITSKWAKPEEKCWAMFYWNHIARRQTAPMILHGMELTDPIRQFNDYGFTMCSTISGVNCGIWHAMGLKPKFFDISNHTVAEVFYDERWHMYDNSLSALYTLCDGKTLAGAADIGKTGSCEVSGGKAEPGHIARYHCLTATSPNGFLIGADCARSLEEEYRCFNPNGLKPRSYYFNWDLAHRYILNLRDNEVYARTYRHLGESPNFYVPNHGADPEKPNPRYRIRGNGLWRWTPSLREFAKSAYGAKNIAATPESPELQPARAGEPAEVVYRVSSANVATALSLRAEVSRKTSKDQIVISVSTTNGLRWREVWKAEETGALVANVNLVDEVNGAYEILLRVELLAAGRPADARLQRLYVETTTMINSKTQPKLNLGRNTVYVGSGDATDSIVFWPELQGQKYKEHLAEEKNIATAEKHPEYLSVLHPAKANEEGYIVYRVDAPNDIVRLTYGGRFYNRAPKSHCDLLHSVDGTTWTPAWSLTDNKEPWDVIHYETVEVPRGHKSVWVKYSIVSTAPNDVGGGSGLYAARIEANFVPLDPGFKPLEVTFSWKERRKDRSLVERSHTQLVEKLPCRYDINVGGEDHPVMESLTANVKGSRGALKYGYSDGKDVGGEKFVGRRLTLGKNLAIGKKYVLSHPSGTSWGAGDPDGKKLTDGIAGPSYAGGTSYQWAAVWEGNLRPSITLDLGEKTSCASFGMNFHGYPWWDAMKGEVKDRVEVLVSLDGEKYESAGFLDTDWRWKDLPVNHMWPDEETIQGATFRLVPPAPVNARYVRYKIDSQRIIAVTELEVLERLTLEPFDLRLALPDEK